MDRPPGAARDGPTEPDLAAPGSALADTQVGVAGGEPGAPGVAWPERSGPRPSRPSTPELESARTALADPSDPAPPAWRGPTLRSPEGPSAGAEGGGPPTDHEPPPSRAGLPRLRAFGPYSAVELLAEQGSVGVVARGFNADFGRWELLKFLRPELAEDPELVRQFRREGRVLAQLAHPNVVQVFATHDLDGSPCLALEFLHGESLEALVRRSGPLTVELGRALLLDAARGLEAAHEAGLLHRDIKPENLFVAQRGPGRALTLKLIDFGLATADRARGSGTGGGDLVSGTVGGTPLYMAPELWRAEPATPATDLYALGLSAWLALSGVHPLLPIPAVGLRLAVLDPAPFPSLALRRPDLPAALVAVVDRLVSKDPAHRFAHAGELVEALLVAAAADRPRRVPESGPFPGARSFDGDHADVLFGREHDLAEAVEHLRGGDVLAVVGPAGSGKTSFLRAGLLPALAAGALGTPAAPRVAAVDLAGRAGSGAHAELLAAVRAAIPEAGAPGAPASGPSADRVARWMGDHLPEGDALVLVVDGLEALVAPRADPGEALRVAATLAGVGASRDPRLHLVVAARSEGLEALLELPALAEVIGQRVFPLRPLAGEALRRAAEGPLRAAGYTPPEGALLSRLEDDARAGPAPLVLAAVALAAWWAARDTVRRSLPASAWQALGGVPGAAAAHAERVLAALAPADRSAALAVLARLSGDGGARRSVERAALVDPAVSGERGEAALRALVQGRVVIEQGSRCELLHPSLPARCAPLREVVGDDPAARRLQERLASAAALWAEAGRPDELTWSGRAARELVAWAERTAAPLSQDELAFIQATRSVVRRGRLLGRAWLGMAALGLVTLLLVWRGQVSGAERRAVEATTSRDNVLAHARQQAAELLAEVARARVGTDPAGALRAAREAHAQQIPAHPGAAPAAWSGARATERVAWEATARGVPRLLPRQAEAVVAVAVEAHGRWLATAGADGAVHALPVRGEGALAAQLPAGDVASGLAFDAAGTVLAIATRGGRLHLLELPGEGAPRPGGAATLRERRACPGDDGAQVAWTSPPRGQPRGAEAPASLLLLRCSGAARERLEVLPAAGAPRVLHEGASDGFSASPRRARLGVLTGAELLIIDPVSGATVRRARGGARLAAVADTGAALLVDAAGRAAVVSGDGPVVWRASPHAAPVRRAMASSDGQRFLTIDEAGRLVVWSGEGAPLGSHDGVLPQAAWIEERGLLAAVERAGTVLVLSAQRAEVVGRWSGGDRGASALAVDEGGHHALVATRDGVARWLDLGAASPRITAPPPGAAPPCALAVDGSAAACAGGRRAVAWRLASADPPGAPTEAPPATAVAVARKAAALHFVDAAGVVSSPGRERLQSGLRGVRLLALDGGLLVAGEAASGQHATWWPTTGASVRLEVSRPVTALGSTPEGDAVALGLDDGSLVVGSLPAGPWSTERPFLKTPVSALLPGSVSSPPVAANILGRVVVRRGPDWVRVHQAREPVACLAWLGGGEALLVGGAAGTLRVVDPDDGGSFELLDVGEPLVACAEAHQRVVALARSGAVWERVIDTRPPWVMRSPDVEPPALERWTGLGARP